MPIFLDTSFIVAVLNRNDSQNKKATKILNKIFDGVWGHPITTDYVADESFTVLFSKTKNQDILRKLFNFIHGNEEKGIPSFIEFKEISKELYFESWNLQEKYNDHSFSFTDLTILTVCFKFKIEHLASFDSDFDGILTRIF